MSNMSYCKFENTSFDLEDCLESVFGCDDFNALYQGLSSEQEREGFTRLMNLILDAQDCAKNALEEIEE